MNLVTADNFKLFNKEGKGNILIGSWCLNNEEIKKNFNKDKDIIANYHWDQKEKISKDVTYIEKIYKYFLDKLTHNLNEFHKTNYNSKTWEILIGLWLKYYISFLFDRWEQTSIVLEKFKIQEAKFVKFNEERFITSNSFDYRYMILHSNWNHWVISKIIESKKKFNFSYINDETQLKKKPHITKEEKKSFLMLFSRFFSKLVFKQKLVIASLYLPTIYKIGLLLKYNKFILKLDFDKKFKRNIDINSRKKIFNDIKGIDEFTNFASSLIYLNFPCSYFENFELLNTEIEKSILPKKPKIIFTSIEHVYNDFFQLYCIKKKREGAKLIVFQHGAHFNKKFSLGDDLEADVADKFLTWGTSPKPNKTIPLFMPTVIKKKVNKSFLSSGLLIAHSSLPVFPGNYDSSPRYYSDIISYNEKIYKLIDNIDKKILLSSSVKVNKSIAEEHRIFWPINSLKEKFPKLNLISPNEPMWKTSRKYKIVVETHNSTGFLEAMYLNIPVILLIDPKADQFKSEYDQYYEDLKEVNILQYDGEKTAKFINSIYDNPSKWWFEKKTQKIRENFCSKFAVNKKNPYKEMISTLNNILISN